MIEHNPNPTSESLKNPSFAAFLAWLVPGLGHYYQGRTAKAILFAILIWTTFIVGVILSSSPTMGPGRAVFVSMRRGEVRYYFLTQIWAGAPALPAVLQYYLDPTGEEPILNGFMAPPVASSGRNDQPSDLPTLNNLKKEMNRRFELGTIFTMTAGLLNLFVIFDAWWGPVDERKKVQEEEKKRGFFARLFGMLREKLFGKKEA
ncbi:MAG: hypothetical protein Q4D38_01655 [Planctomycetia bacterium]|nr:hypothetical protein [Planctomycetia bacterium]